MAIHILTATTRYDHSAIATPACSCLYVRLLSLLRPTTALGASSSSEASDAPTTESEEVLDWSFMDILSSPDVVGMDFPTAAAAMDDFSYDFFAPSMAAAPPDVAEENGGVGFGGNSFLWSF